MKKKFLWLVVLLIISSISEKVCAQEFGLKVQFFRNTDNTPVKTIAFGYDPNASDTLEGPQSWFPGLGGEQLAPPVGFDWDFRVSGNYIRRFADLGEGSYVDIRKKQ